MARVIALNNYPLAKMCALAGSGAIPRQHTWGVDALAPLGHTVELAPFHEPDEHHPLDRLGRRMRGALGHIDQELFAIRRLRAVDVVYCADGTGLAGIALLRRVLPRARLVSVVHHPIRSHVRLLAIARQDAVLCLSPAVREMLAGALPRERPELIDAPWGPDLGSPLYRPRGEELGVVCAGKSNRDLATLVAALERVEGAPALVYDLAARVNPEAADRIRLRRPGGAGADPDSPGGFLASTVIADLAAASVVAIPISDTDRLTGLTEATDALALGKPILATRTPYFPFDVEAVGCGRWIEPGDVDGWTRRLAELSGDPALRARMGQAGRRFAERTWNYEAFCSALSAAIR